MATLRLYHDIQPNLNNEYWLFNTFSQLLNKLSSKLAKTLNIDNYRINANVIRIKDVGPYSYDNITYIIEEVSNNYWRAFHVDSVTYQSGFAFFTLTRDLWADYISKAQFSNIHISRCNRLIDIPIFDNIKATSGNEQRLTIDSNGAYHGIATPDYLTTYKTINNYALVMVINYNAKQNLTGDRIASTTAVFAINLETLRNKYIEGIDPSGTLTPEESELYYNKSAVEMARDFAGGIYGITATGFSKNDAHVVNAYIIDTTFISASGWNVDYSSVSILKHGTITLTASLLSATDKTPTPLYVRSLDLNKKVYVGLEHGGLLLNRVVNENYAIVYLRVTINVSSVVVIISQGDNQEDITSAFELTITNNVTQDTLLRHIAKSIERTASASKSIMKGYESGGATGAIGGALSSFASLVGDYSLDSKIRGSGDALVTYGGYAQYVNIPYKATAYTSIDNEAENARNKGANFSKYISSFYDLFDNINKPLLGTGSLTSTFVIASCNIDGIPTEANDYIKNVLAGGAYLIDART